MSPGDEITTTDPNTRNDIHWTVTHVKPFSRPTEQGWTHQIALVRSGGGKVRPDRVKARGGASYLMYAKIEGGRMTSHSRPMRAGF